ncbi:MutS-related protein [Robertkochia aurantiaca]|uniref:MutS-related protein n=1 Tax=Robertkochia aurantiaca TaxID=2873700 RepID=UPI001CCDC8AC|nr:DNA mismatch repair protein MutS [Robertkochia sp. 3YJGBD-33]
MQIPAEYYQQRLEHYKKQRQTVGRALRYTSVLRLFVFAGTAIFVYYFFDLPAFWIPGAVVGLGIFLYLVKRYQSQKYERDKTDHLIRINETELQVLQKNFHHLDAGEEFIDPSHDFSHDIDLFGKASFFQYLNRTATLSGRSGLAELLLKNDPSGIADRQEAIKELSEKSDWRQEFQATALMVENKEQLKAVLERIKSFSPSLPGNLKWLPLVFSIASIVMLSLAISSVLPASYVVYWFIFGILISGSFFRRITALSLRVSAAQEIFAQYYKLLNLIEETGFQAEKLTVMKAKLNASDPAGILLKKLSRYIDALDQRNNLLVGIIGNAFFQMDLYNGYRIESWLSQHQKEILNWFEAVSEFDTYSSFGNFAFNHQHYHFPELTGEPITLSASTLGHPLIAEAKMIMNDIEIQRGEFFVITGANMAGKSTFLRTVSLSIVMANTGLPVFASSFSYNPIRLITSMRTSDSLSDEASYFFAELKRLKRIREKLKDQDYFVILDEILKGTNSKDKAIGSRKFVEYLSDTHSTGIIATHDLSLCEIEKDREEVKNYFFDATIKNDELSFDYKLRKGICTNMNASFLLSKMGIV